MNEVSEYIDQQEADLRPQLMRMRELITAEAPSAVEKISYGVPTYVLHKNLVHFGAAKHHIGFYPGPSAIEHFGAELSSYHTSKGAIQFPLHEPLPEDLIRRIVRFRVRENEGA